jgi:hypothetical protein
MATNVAAMGIADWAALLFAIGIAALAVVGELKVRHLSALSRCSLEDLSLDQCCPPLAEQDSVRGATRILRCAPSRLRTPGTG